MTIHAKIVNLPVILTFYDLFYYQMGFPSIVMPLNGGRRDFFSQQEGCDMIIVAKNCDYSSNSFCFMKFYCQSCCVPILETPLELKITYTTGGRTLLKIIEEELRNPKMHTLIFTLIFILGHKLMGSLYRILLSNLKSY